MKAGGSGMGEVEERRLPPVPRPAPSWAQIQAVAQTFRTEFGGAYTYVAAALEHDHQSLNTD